MGARRGVNRVLVGKHKEKGQLGRPRRRWQENAKMYLLEVGWEGMNWTDLAQDKYKWRALVNALMKLRVP